MTDEQIQTVRQIVDSAQHIVVIQADNPDADSLGSALSLEGLLIEQGKQVSMYCGIDMPSYLTYLPGWDRVSKTMPHKFDASIIVDASTKTLLQSLSDSGELSWIAAKPCIVLDHHEIVRDPIDFAEVSIIDPQAASTGILITSLAQSLNWNITAEVADSLLTSILGDTQGLTNNLATAETYRTIASLIDAGADRPKLEELRREKSKMTADILKYKATLINNTVFSEDGKIATVVVPQHEISTYSPLYNPAPLIQGDLLMTEGVEVAIVFKVYDSGRVTASIRCNNSAPIANKLAEQFDGGGHAFAAGFKQNNVNDFIDLKTQVLAKTGELLR